jgi:ADP-heptose:LPS heptosyltransferase
MALLETNVIPHCCDFKRPLDTISELRSSSLDVLIDLCPWSFTTALLCWFSGSRFTTGFSARGNVRGRAFDKPIEHLPNRHETENLRALADQFAPLQEYRFGLQKNFPDPGLALAYERLVLIHTRPGGSRAVAKSWPEDHWLDLVRSLYQDGFDLGFTGSADDRAGVEMLIHRSGLPASRCFSLCGDLSLGELGYVLQRACLVITVDTAILHFAAALNCRVIGLHGPTSSAQWGAKCDQSISIDSPHPAAGYICFGYESHRSEKDIMRGISPKMVYTEVSRLNLITASEPGTRAASIPGTIRVSAIKERSL